MGATFTNIQIHYGYEYDKTQIINQLNKYLYDSGFEPVSNGKDTVRTITVKFCEESPWITMYDDFLQDIALNDLKNTVKNISKHLEKSVIGISVFDSDVLMMYLKDITTDKTDLMVCADDDDYAEELGYNPKTSKGTLKRWMSFVNPGVDKNTFNQITRDKYVFAEDRLHDLSELIPFDKDAVLVGDIQYCEDPHPNDVYTIELAYREGYMPPYQIVKKGLPVFDYYGSSTGYINEIVVANFHNVGGVGKGVTFILEGEILKKHNLVFSEPKVRKQIFDKNLPFGVGWDIHESEFDKKTEEHGNVCYIASFEDFVTHEGVKVNVTKENIFSDMWKGINIPWQKIDRSIFEKKLVVCFCVNSDAELHIDDDVYVTLIPHDNPINGKCTKKVKIKTR